MKGFGSDNHSGVHPRLLESITFANEDHAPSYGTDSWTTRANQQFYELFQKKVNVFYVYNGTAANVLCLRALMKPWQSAFCSNISHLNLDECASPEFMTGGKLIPLPSQNGKISLTTLQEHFIRRGDQHYPQSKVISLTQPTEVGTCYTLQEIKEITDWAHAKGLYVHIDGARIANAVAHLQSSFYEMLTSTNVDALSFGGTKNGFLMGEAVIFFNSQFAEDFPYIRKQTAQLPSKTRFIAAQFETYLKENLWHIIATHSLQMAKYLQNAVHDIPFVKITQPVESNAVFATIPQHWVKPLREKFFFYVWDEKTFECRWMTSFDTQKIEIEAFAEELKLLSKKERA